MKERPILFSGEMVRAILDGRKTQTRRVVKPQPDSVRSSALVKSGYETKHGYEIKCPYGQPGDRLWVRESFQLVIDPEKYIDEKTFKQGKISLSELFGNWHQRDKTKVSDDKEHYWIYKADGNPVLNTPLKNIRWKPSIHMPRIASRINLEITNIRIERLQDISEEDATAEGTSLISKDTTGNKALFSTRRNAYRCLWESINGNDRLARNCYTCSKFVEIDPVKAEIKCRED
jgi:hypothetical protein